MHIHYIYSISIPRCSSRSVPTFAGDLNTLSPLDAEAYNSTDLLSVLLADQRLTDKFLDVSADREPWTASYDFAPMNALLGAGLTDLAARHPHAW